jgi:uncharacterized protein (TIGR02300 family)
MTVANTRGTKREDPDTGKKFYDLNKDPIVSPYTGKSYPRSYFEQTAVKGGRASAKDEEEEEVEVEEVVEAVAPDAPVIVSLDEAEAEEEAAEGEEVIPDVEGVEEVEDIGEDEADVFLEEEEEEENLDFDVGGADER